MEALSGFGTDKVRNGGAFVARGPHNRWPNDCPATLRGHLSVTRMVRM